MKLPILNFLKLTNVSLYNNGDPIKIEFNKNSTLLVGVNGIGKSTLLNLITYALTGIIKHPTYKFKSIYDLDDKNKTKEYFTGRISQLDMQSADIELKFTIDNTPIIVKRNFEFNNSFKYAIIDNEQCISYEEYKNSIVELSNIHSFEQFIFLVLYILYFDEQKQLIFWDKNLLTATFNIVFNIDPDESIKIENLYSILNKTSSDIRNRVWQIKKMKDDLELLESSKSSNLSLNEEDVYNNLVEKIHGLEESKNSYENQHNNSKFNLSSLLIKKNELELEYEKKYSDLFNVSTSIKRVKNNAIVQELIEHSHCTICNSNNINLTEIYYKIDNNICPICNTVLSMDNNFNVEELKKIDIELQEVNKNIEILNKEIPLLFSKYEESLNNLSIAKKEYDDKYSNISMFTTDPKLNEKISALEITIGTQSEIVETLRLEERDYKQQIEIERKKLIDRYNAVKDKFIPIFKELAQSFIGLNINIDLAESKQYERPTLSLNLYLNNIIRDNFTSLSESQRFFIDIALRMAIILFLNKQNNNIGGTMLLDTPEGSLDIAYEVNAGNMLTKYANEETQLILTANINSSGLLYQIASKSNKDKISVIDLKKWSLLTEVQNKNIKILDNALTNITSVIGENYDKQ